MTATVTVDSTVRNYYSSFNASLVAGFSALGISGSDVVYNASTHVIFKVSSGTGTYADNYLYFKQNGRSTYSHSLTVGTGYTGGYTITGGGILCGAFYAYSGDYTHRTIKADDNSFGLVQIMSGGSVIGSYGFVKPTTTTESAADIPLVVGLCSIHSYAFQTDVNSGSISWRAAGGYHYYGYGTKYQAADGSNTSVQPYGNLRNVYAGARKGSFDTDAFAQSTVSSGGQSSSGSYSYHGNVPYSAAFGLDSNIDGNLPVMPNAVVKSGGVPIGYNSNLAYCKPGLNPGDNIIVTANSEEYKVISSDGLAIRTV
tara:strand:- start:605 stop:1543 length:939 start_codon:yes stop_codon:yes gene_type:complete